MEIENLRKAQLICEEHEKRQKKMICERTLEEFMLNGILTCVKKDIKIVKCKLYYVIQENLNNNRITYRNLLCEIPYEEVNKIEVENNISINDINELSIIGTFNKMGIFKVKQIIDFTTSSNSQINKYHIPKNISSKYKEDIFNKIIEPLREFNEYLDSQDKDDNIVYCTTLYQFIADQFKTSSYDMTNLSISVRKIQLILDDIAMLNTEIDSDYSDQLNVLYDSTCLSAMCDFTIIFRSLLIIYDGSLKVQDLICFMVIYFKTFYSAYIRTNKLDADTNIGLIKYENICKQILYDLEFDYTEMDNVYTQLLNFKNLILKM